MLCSRNHDNEDDRSQSTTTALASSIRSTGSRATLIVSYYHSSARVRRESYLATRESSAAWSTGELSFDIDDSNDDDNGHNSHGSAVALLSLRHV